MRRVSGWGKCVGMLLEGGTGGRSDWLRGGVELQVRERRERTMIILRAFGVEVWVIQDLLPVIGGIKVCPVCAMQSDEQLANILEQFHADEPALSELVSLCGF